MFAWGRDSVDKDTMDLKKCCIGMRLVVQRTRAWSRTRLHLQEQLPNGLSVFLFIDSYKTRGRTTGIIEKFNLASASPVTTQYIVTHAEIV